MTSRSPRPFEFFLIGTEFFGIGGIQQVNRLLLQVFLDFARDKSCRLHVFSFRDSAASLPGEFATHPNLRWHAFNCGRAAMASALAREMLSLRPHGALFTHAGLLRLAWLFKTLSPRTQIGLLGHGVEVWKRLSGLGPYLLTRLDSLVAPSAYTAAQLAEANGLDRSCVSVIPHALPPDWKVLPKKTNRAAAAGHKLLSVARLTPADVYKGVGQVIGAMPLLRDAHPQTILRIAGDGADRPRLEALARSLWVEKQVQFLGEVTDTRLQELYADSDLFVLPSKKEGFGLVYLEAMFHGLPVVAAGTGGATDIIQSGVNGVLVSGDDKWELAAAISQLWQAPEKTAQMVAAAQARVAEHYLFPTFARAWSAWMAGLCPQPIYAAAQSSFRAPASFEKLASGIPGR